MRNHTNIRPWKKSLAGICFAYSFVTGYFLTTAFGGANASANHSGNSTMQVMKPRPVAKFDGVRIVVHPNQESLAVIAITVNQGKGTMTLNGGDGRSGCRVSMFDHDGNRLPYTTAREKKEMTFRPGSLVYLDPGKLRKKTFALDQYYLIPLHGHFYVYASRLVVGGKWDGGSTVGLVQKYVRSPILKLTLRQGAPPVWKVVPVIPRPSPKARPAQLVEPPNPKYNVPTTGPIATLVQISDAVHAHDLKLVEQYCYHGDARREPFFLASARDAIAISVYCEAIQKRFGVDPEEHLSRTHSTPETFSHFVAEVDPRSLKINGDRAMVGTMYFDGKRFVLTPDFAFHFRNVKGRWLLDSRATYQRSLTARQYRLNVDNSLKEARMFDSLKRDLTAGRFATLKELTAVANRRMAEVDHWFMLQSMKKNKQWMKDNAQWVKTVKGEGKPAATQPSKTPH